LDKLQAKGSQFSPLDASNPIRFLSVRLEVGNFNKDLLQKTTVRREAHVAMSYSITQAPD